MLDLNAEKEMSKLLEKVVQENASDLHLSEGRPPTLRVDGQLKSLDGDRVLNPEKTKMLIFSLLSPEDEKRFEKEKAIDFSYTHRKEARFRVNVYYQKGYVSAAFRLIPNKIRTIEDLSLPVILRKFCLYSQGFFLVVGPSGHGKTTALSAMIDEINTKRSDHIITIEDPIEYIFEQKKCIIDQREVYRDTHSFQKALKSTLRQDPDVIMVGEMRDPETFEAALTAAETGHLVFATLHTNDAAQTIDRIVDSFPPHQQGQIRYQMASTLIGVLSRRLIPKIGGDRINAIELLITNGAVRNLIRENKIYQLPSIIETSFEEGMISLNRSLAELVKQEQISVESALTFSANPNELKLMI
jgi:twitching motility protein PilT